MQFHIDRKKVDAVDATSIEDVIQGTHFNWGEYAIWHLGPTLKVSLDGRRETVYSDSQLDRQFGIINGTEAGITELARMRPEYVWLPLASDKTARWLIENGYREDIRTERSYVASRSDLTPLTPWRGTPSGCFPGP